MSARRRIRIGHLCAASGLLAVLAAAIWVVSGLASGGSPHGSAGREKSRSAVLRSGPAPTTSGTVYRMDADHPTYPTVLDVTGSATAVVSGEALSHSVEPGDSPGVDELGDPLPAIPHTIYVVRVATVLKGAIAPGGTIDVVVAGGNTPEGEFVLDGAPSINDGETALFFLSEGPEGRYYPLAGGAAVAARVGADAYELPPDATGEAKRVVNEEEVRSAVTTKPISSSSPESTHPGASVPPPAAGSTAAAKQGLHCPKHSRKKKLKGRLRCVKVKARHRRHHHAHPAGR